MRVVAIQATLAYRGMFKNERPTLLGMTLETHLIDGICLEQGIGRTAVRIVAVTAGHLAFEQGHVRPLVEFDALLLVTAKTGFVNGLLGQRTRGGKTRHRVVTIATGKVVVLVR